jgi:hypothetical protein
MRRTLSLLPILLALLGMAVLVPSAGAKRHPAKKHAAKPHAAKPLVGIGDQNFLMFQDKRFQRLHLKVKRIAVPWDWYTNPSYLTFMDRWLADARAAGVKPLIAFTREWDDKGATYKVPVSRLVESFKAFRARYPDITDFTAWNEANHPSQPTWNAPQLAARYYKALHAACPSYCRITAADVLDTNNVAAWLGKFLRYVHNGRLWGLHSYKDPNNGTTWHTRELMRMVKGQVWLTETGGIKRLKPNPGAKSDGRKNSLHGQAVAVQRVYALAKAYSGRVKRIYFYQWQQDPSARWDSAFVDRHGKLRPAYTALRKGL